MLHGLSVTSPSCRTGGNAAMFCGGDAVQSYGATHLTPTKRCAMLTCDRPTGIPAGEPPMPCCQTVQPDVPTGLPKHRLIAPKMTKSAVKVFAPTPAHIQSARLPALRK